MSAYRTNGTGRNSIAGLPSIADAAARRVFDTGSKRSVPAGHYINLDKVKARYREKYLLEEEQKAKKLVALASEAEARAQMKALKNP